MSQDGYLSRYVGIGGNGEITWEVRVWYLRDAPEEHTGLPRRWIIFHRCLPTGGDLQCRSHETKSLRKDYIEGQVSGFLIVMPSFIVTNMGG